MSWIKTHEEIEAEKKRVFTDLINQLGGYIKLDRAIMFRETPHMPTQWINNISIKDDFDSFGLAKDTVIQRLRLEISKRK